MAFTTKEATEWAALGVLQKRTQRGPAPPADSWANYLPGVNEPEPPPVCHICRKRSNLFLAVMVHWTPRTYIDERGRTKTYQALSDAQLADLKDHRRRLWVQVCQDPHCRAAAELRGYATVADFSNVPF